MTDRILIIGSDSRLIKAAEAFALDSFPTRVYDGSEPLKTAVDQSDIVVLGLPATNDSSCVVTGHGAPIPIRDIAALCGKRTLVFGGRFTEKDKAVFDLYSVKWFDYSLYPEFEILNAVPTAEGAIALAMDEYPFTLHSSPVIVTGYGKVAKALSSRLKALGALCTVAARSPSQRAEADSLGLSSIDLSRLPDAVKSCRILFNTVPARIIDKSVLSRMSPSSGIIDLASKPGGVNLEDAKTYGINVIWALGIPGKAAPQSAGEIIKKTVCNIAVDLLR